MRILVNFVADIYIYIYMHSPPLEFPELCSCVSCTPNPSPPPTLILGLLGGISDVVLAASVGEHDAHLGDPGPGALAGPKTVVRQIAEGLTRHGPPLHVGHLLHSVLQVLLVVVATQRELLPKKKKKKTRICESWNRADGVKGSHSEPHLFDRAGVLHESHVRLAVRDVQFVNDLVDPLLNQLKVLRADAFGAVDQEHHIRCRVAASW